MFDKLLENIDHIALFVGVLLATFLAAFLMNRFFKRMIKRSSTDMNNDPTNYMFLKHAIIASMYLVGF
ncbi:MAG: mechanosensitive ion channel family protein, partial [Bacteroidota bacterium]